MKFLEIYFFGLDDTHLTYYCSYFRHFYRLQIRSKKAGTLGRKMASNANKDFRKDSIQVISSWLHYTLIHVDISIAE
jgi:hypothetical protein